MKTGAGFQKGPIADIAGKLSKVFQMVKCQLPLRLPVMIHHIF
jgi:hypothetical protein